jgi:hypothetical protein
MWRSAPCHSPHSLVQRLVRHLFLQALCTERWCRELLPRPWCAQTPCPLCCVSFTVPCLSFSFFWGGVFFFFCSVGVSLSRSLCWFLPGVAVGIPHATYLLTWWSVFPKQVWSRHLAAQEPSCFLSVTWHGEALYQLGVQGVKSFASSWWFFPAKCGSSISTRFLIYRVHAVSFFPLVAILDPPSTIL